MDVKDEAGSSSHASWMKKDEDLKTFHEERMKNGRWMKLWDRPFHVLGSSYRAAAPPPAKILSLSEKRTAGGAFIGRKDNSEIILRRNFGIIQISADNS